MAVAVAAARAVGAARAEAEGKEADEGRGHGNRREPLIVALREMSGREEQAGKEQKVKRSLGCCYQQSPSWSRRRVSLLA